MFAGRKKAASQGRRESHNVLLGALIATLSTAAIADIEPRFYAPANVSQNSGLSFNPTIAIDNSGAAYVAWNDNSLGNMEVLLVRTLDGGKTFSSPLNISQNAGLSTFPTIEAAPDGVLHMVYQDGDGGQSAIYYTRSSDQGLTFSTPIKISADGKVAVNSHLVIDSLGNLYVTYSTADTLYVARSSNGGSSFAVQSQTRVKNYVSSQLAIGQSDSVHLAWADRSDIMYGISTNGGRSFSLPKNLSNTLASSKSPSLGTDTLGNVYVTWSEEITKKNSEIFMTKSIDNGSSFDAAMNLTNNAGFSIEPDLHVDVNGNIHLVWQDTTLGNYEAVYATSEDFGNTFSPMTNIAPSEFGSLVTKVKTDSDGNIFVAWDDNRTGNFEMTVTTGRTDIAAITAHVSPVKFTPNGDGIDDVTRMTAFFTEFLDWSMVIEDYNGVVVASLNGSGSDLDVTWDGIMNNGELAISGLYTFRIAGRDMDGREAVPVSGKVELSDDAVVTTPEITFFDASPFIDPDGDGRRDTAVFEATFNKSMDWSLELIDIDGNVIFADAGTGLSFSLIWNGMANTGLLAADGVYTLELVAVDGIGNSVGDSRSVTVDSIDPQWSNMVITESFSPDGDGVNDIALIDFDISEGALVTLYVFEASTGSLVRELSRNAYTEATHVSEAWDGLNGGGQPVAAGNYEYSIWIRDYAANRANPYPIRKTVTVE